MHIAHGTREVIGRMLFCDGLDKLMPGETTYAQVRLEDPLPVRSGDRFVVRTYSPVQVAGGGMILLAHPRRRTTLSEPMRALLDTLRDGRSSQAIRLAVEVQNMPATAKQIAILVGCDEETVVSALSSPDKASKIETLGKADGDAFYTTQPVMRKLAGAIERTLIRFHSDNPTEAGMAKEALRRKCFPNMTTACFDALVDHLASTGAIVAQGGLVGHPSAQGPAQQALDNAADALAQLLSNQGMAPESLGYLAKSAGLTQQMASKAMGALVTAGRAYRVSNDLFFDAATIDAAKAAIAAHLRAGKPGTAAALKEAMGTSRKYAMPLLEKFDAEGFTKRVGDERMLG